MATEALHRLGVRMPVGIAPPAGNQRTVRRKQREKGVAASPSRAVVPDLQEVNVRERGALGSPFGGGKPLQQFLLARLSRIARKEAALAVCREEED